MTTFICLNCQQPVQLRTVSNEPIPRELQYCPNCTEIRKGMREAMREMTRADEADEAAELARKNDIERALTILRRTTTPMTDAESAAFVRALYPPRGNASSDGTT